MKMILLLAISLTCASARAAGQSEIIAGWLARQTNIQTWAAGFKQTRTLQSLSQPLVSTGQVWFAAPQNFRWELGQNQTIAVRKDDEMLVVYPRLKRAERYELGQGEGNQWKDTMALLQTGFPRSAEDLRRQFNILGIQPENGLHRLELEPKSAAARKMMPRINIFMDRENLTLAGTELVFADGSSMRNDFFNVRTNIDATGRFDFAIPPDFKVTQPLKNR